MSDFEAVRAKSLAEAAERHKQQEAARAQQLEQDRLNRLWDRATSGTGRLLRETEEWVVANPDGETPPFLVAWCERLAELVKELAARQMLDKLTTPPTGIQGNVLDAWHWAVEILRAARTDLKSTAQLLRQAACTAPTLFITRWLVSGLREQIEGRDAPEVSADAGTASIEGDQQHTAAPNVSDRFPTATAVTLPSPPQQEGNPLPWGGPEWDAQPPLTRRLLRYMNGRKSVLRSDLEDTVWAERDIKPPAIRKAVHNANKYLGKIPDSPLLECAQDDQGNPIVRWV